MKFNISLELNAERSLLLFINNGATLNSIIDGGNKFRLGKKYIQDPADLEFWGIK